ncbi:MAG: four helix bundle protein [Flexilinea sp.]|nr:four helix bundle protein [Flexilinea sp.]
MASYRELRVWKKAIELVTEIYQLCKYLPKEETYGLSDQMKRAAVSIPSNIAEGQARNSEKDFIRFLYIAQGSRAELETQLEICVQLHYLSKDQIASAEAISAQTGRMIRTLIGTLQRQSLPTTNHQPPTVE